MSCSVCEATRPRALVCPQCFAASSAGRQADRRSLLEQRDAAQQQLQTVLADKVTHQWQQLQLLRLAEELHDTQQRAEEVARQLQAVNQLSQAAGQELLQRQQHLHEAQHDLVALSHQMQALMAPYRNQKAQACVRSLEALAQEQCTKVMWRAIEILPLSLVPLVWPASPHSGSSSSRGRPATAAERNTAAICSLLLPDSRNGMAELAQLSRSLGSALGYLALLLDLLSRFLQLPVAHRAAFQGSTSRFWQPDSFFDMRATPPNDALHLRWPTASDGGGGLSFSTLASGGGSGAAAAQQRQRQEQQLRAALHGLQRSAGMLVYARLGPDAALKVPEDQAPFTWLAKLCRLLVADPRHSSGHIAVPGAQDLAASAVLGHGVQDSGSFTSQSVLFQDGCTADEAAEDDWEHLPDHGMMPPRPWESEDVEHWVQANFADNGAAGGGGGGTVPPGTSPMATLLAWTTTTLKRGLGATTGS